MLKLLGNELLRLRLLRLLLRNKLLLLRLLWLLLLSPSPSCEDQLELIRSDVDLLRLRGALLSKFQWTYHLIRWIGLRIVVLMSDD